MVDTSESTKVIVDTTKVVVDNGEWTKVVVAPVSRLRSSLNKLGKPSVLALKNGSSVSLNLSIACTKERYIR